VTTIASRLGHLIGGVFGARNATHFLVLHLHREAIHHGAEVLLLRDLYRTR
jgi:hypothetical protein